MIITEKAPLPAYKRPPAGAPVKGLHAAMRRWRRIRAAFPETPIVKLPGRVRALERRRAKNRRARASRKRNRP